MLRHGSHVSLTWISDFVRCDFRFEIPKVCSFESKRTRKCMLEVFASNDFDAHINLENNTP